MMADFSLCIHLPNHYTPENQDDNGKATINEDVSPIKKRCFSSDRHVREYWRVTDRFPSFLSLSESFLAVDFVSPLRLGFGQSWMLISQVVKEKPFRVPAI